HCLLLARHAALPSPHSFPTRRSSDLDVFLDAGSLAFQATQVIQLGTAHLALALHGERVDGRAVRLEHALHAGPVRNLAHGEGRRSEEHTSELQSRENLVCRLLLVKKI